MAVCLEREDPVCEARSGVLCGERVWDGGGSYFFFPIPYLLAFGILTMSPAPFRLE
jgi:hypothetical protein